MGGYTQGLDGHNSAKSWLIVKVKGRMFDRLQVVSQPAALEAENLLPLV